MANAAKKSKEISESNRPQFGRIGRGVSHAAVALPVSGVSGVSGFAFLS